MKKFRFLYIAAAALLFAACANEEDGIGNNGPVAATVKADIVKNITRATTGDTWSKNDAIGVYVTSPGYTIGDNVKYTTTGDGNFTSDNPIYFADARETVIFNAYYPYQENMDGNGIVNNWNMAEVKEGEPCPADFLFARDATATKSSPQVQFTGDNQFKHCMSMIRLTFKAGDGINANNANLKNKLKLKGIYKTGSINTLTGEVTVSGDRGIYESDVNDKSLKNGVTCEFIVFPQSLDNNKMDIELEVADNGSINTYTASLPSSTNNEFKGGNQYTYTIRICNTGVIIENAGIESWQPNEEGPLDAEQQ
ncbi:fimbrillin family protein [Segatella copri]|uniref:fimbrillin family protein n=1 Tax=Segatella copri TaxID=165179 RepID=UPI002230F24C|nr:fimbrillin family protein [Segatella copri]MCW4123610.1 fimbrillin family protein [Segatella copri]MCW4134035.1 fimbrillin family protein [Segatella copri]